MLHQLRLLRGRLYLNEANVWPARRLTDRLCGGCIILVALEVRLHIFRRHYSQLMTQLGEFSGPIMRCGAGL